MAPTVQTSQTSLRNENALVSADYAELLAHVRAAVAAARDGELDPMVHLTGFLEERGQLPPADMSASQLAAQAFARTADADRLFGGRS